MYREYKDGLGGQVVVMDFKQGCQRKNLIDGLTLQKRSKGDEEANINSQMQLGSSLLSQDSI